VADPVADSAVVDLVADLEVCLVVAVPAGVGDKMNIKKFFSDTEKESILNAIKEAEKQTSGEIRLHLEKKCKGSTLDRAIQVFQKLEMHKTHLRNGTLLYLAVKDQKFAIYGDKGINEVVAQDFWDDVKEEIREQFAKGDFTAGVTLGIHRIGEKLKEFFPYQEDDINELPDDISIE
jgi:uncharacterized membrane protein